MAEVALRIGGHDYYINCRDGDEPNLQALAALVDIRVTQARSVVRNASESQQLVMAALLLADEMQDARAATSAPAPIQNDTVLPELTEAVATRLEALAEALENLARHD
jgi:cell division protein ZapA